MSLPSNGLRSNTEVDSMKFTAGERTTPARRVFEVIQTAGGASPYEVYRNTQLVASTRDAEWYCKELYRLGLVEKSGSAWLPVIPIPADLQLRLREVKGPSHRSSLKGLHFNEFSENESEDSDA